MDLKEQAILGDDVADHWYYRAKAAAIARLLTGLRPAHLLDVGAGSGFFARELLRRPTVQSAICVDPGYPADRDELAFGKPLSFRRRIDRASADLVLMLDVLEHVDDDAALLREYVTGAARGTRFVVTVPAFRFLWSGHDVFLEHRRRYTLGALERVVRAGGLRIERGCYFYGALFPLAAASRLLDRLRRGEPKSQLRRSGGLANALLWSACRAELPFFPANRMAGLTAMALAAKP